MSSLRAYAAVTGAYWGFTLTDGALRMLVLLHFHALGYTPLQIAFLFLLYEFFGMATNLLGGWVGSRRGLKPTLLAGLGLQIFALAMLSFLSPDWAVWLSIPYVLVSQGLSGIAKDLTKLSAKSSVKLVAPDGGGSVLFRLVALLTGSKNALKGLGFFLGGALLAGIGFAPALWAMAAALAAILLLAARALPADLGRLKDRSGPASLFAKSREINLLSGARVFLFGSRDVWFAVGLPIFLYDGLGWSFTEVGGFLAAWVIGYGMVQAAAPAVLGKAARARRTEIRAARLWVALLAALPFAIAGALLAGLDPAASVIVGLGVFGAVFAVNSALHSYLILAFADSEKVAMDVGFYYMANAGGRLLGTLLSGAAYQIWGLEGCLLAAGLMLVAAWGLTAALAGPAVRNPLGRSPG